MTVEMYRDGDDLLVAPGGGCTGAGGEAVMDFYEVLEQVLALLQRHGRVSYRALQRQFNLDDAFIEDLKVELIEVQELATDRDNKMLVWTGEAIGAPTSASQPDQTSELSTTQQDQASHTESPIPDAERRQLTVMC